MSKPLSKAKAKAKQWTPIGLPLMATALPPRRTAMVQWSEVILANHIVLARVRGQDDYLPIKGAEHVGQSRAAKDLHYCKLSLDHPGQLAILCELARCLYQHGGALPVAVCERLDAEWERVMEGMEDE